MAKGGPSGTGGGNSLEKDAQGWSPLFPPSGSPPSPATAKLLEWMRAMSDPNSPMPRADPSPLGESPREYLFACARDEFNMSAR